MNDVDIREVEAIDVHAHFGVYRRDSELLEQLQSGSAAVVTSRARMANIGLTIASPLAALLPRLKANAIMGNEEAVQAVLQTPGLLQWVVINPLQKETFRQAAAMLELSSCLGIKIHPEEHGYPIRKYGDELFSFAAQHGAPILTHSGEPNSMPEHFVPFANKYPNITLILAHLGFGYDGDVSHQVRAIQSSTQGNIVVDTSSSMSIASGIVEWAVQEIGADRILFGTDTPLYSTAMQRARIDSAEIALSAKRLILRENALRLLEIPDNVLSQPEVAVDPACK